MNGMKKFMAMLLAVVLVAQSGFMTFATEDTGAADQITVVSEDSENSEQSEVVDVNDETKDESLSDVKTPVTEEPAEESDSETEDMLVVTDTEEGNDSPVDETQDIVQNDNVNSGDADENNTDQEIPGSVDEDKALSEMEREEEKTSIVETEETDKKDEEVQDPTKVEGVEVPTPVTNELPADNTLNALEIDLLADEGVDALADGVLNEGVTILTEGAADVNYNIAEGKALVISGQGASAENPIVFENCKFILSGGTVPIRGNISGVTHDNAAVTKLWIGGNVQFVNCTFETTEGATKTNGAGNDAAIYFYSGDINLNECTLKAEGYNGQFLGLYGKAGSTVTFNNSNISTVGNKNGWSYALYGDSVIKLNNSSMASTGSIITDPSIRNINVFYVGSKGDGRKEVWDAVYLNNSTINFSDNGAGGFVINESNIYIDNSKVTVNNNLGNGCNTGYWYVSNGSEITINGNRGGHGLSCIGFDMMDSKLEVLHNGYAGVYIQSKDSSLTNCTVDIRCNGEKLLSYSAGDTWTGRLSSGIYQRYTLSINNCTSEAQPGSAWLGAVGRMGSVQTTDSDIETIGSSSVVAYDLNDNSTDNLKSNTEPVLEDANVLEVASHILFLNPFMESDYARGNAENKASNNDADLFDDDHVADRSDIIGKDNAKIGSLTEAQLAHHKYDWENGEITDNATENTYGVIRYSCTDTCADYLDHAAEHSNSFDCIGTYVYAPLVGLTFDANTTDSVTNMPESQTQIAYEGVGTRPDSVPVRESGSEQYNYVFAGWYTDPECTQAFDFSEPLTANWTVAYAKWNRSYAPDVNPDGFDVNITKKAEELNADDETTVQLGIGSTENQNKVAVLFVLDYSTSVNVRDEAAAMLEELASKDKTDVKVGVINYWADADSGEWTTITPETDVNSLLSQTQTGGTNYHAGLLSAQELLASDEIDGYTTYLITISDGLTYLWTDEDTGDTLSVWYQQGSNGEYSIQNGNSVVEMKYPGELPGSSAEIPNTIFEALVNGSNDILKKYEATKPYFASYYNSDGTTASCENNKYISFQPDWTDNGKTADDFLIGTEIAIYKSAAVYRDLVDEVDYAFALKMDENHWGQYPYGEQLMDYLISQSDAGSGEISDSTAKTVFQGIENQILYAINSGTVTDVIGNDFDLKNVDTFRLTVGGTEVTGTKDSSNANLVNFGTADESGVYPYTVEYVPGAAGEEHFVWTINVPVENANDLTLSYVLKLVNKSSEAGTYGQYDRDGSKGYESIQTNESAILEYKTTEGDIGSKTFPKPTVSYTVPETPVPEEPTAGTATLNITKKVQTNKGAAKKVSTSFYASIFTDNKYQNRYGDVIELKLTDASEVTVKINVETPADGSSRTYYVMETDKDGNVVSSGKDFGYQIDVKGSQVAVSKTADTADIVITNQQVKSGSGSHSGSGSGGSSDNGTGSAASTPQQVGTAKTGDTGNITLYVVLAAVAVIALAACGAVIYKKRKLTK